METYGTLPGACVHWAPKDRSLLCQKASILLFFFDKYGYGYSKPSQTWTYTRPVRYFIMLDSISAYFVSTLSWV